MTTTPPDINTRVGQYVKLRDEIKRLDDEHKKKMAPYRETLEQLNGALLAHLNSVGAESARTENGTVYCTDQKRASLADKSAFWKHVIQSQNFDLLDWKANANAVIEHLEREQTLPPGVNLSVTRVVGVRRS